MNSKNYNFVIVLIDIRKSGKGKKRELTNY